MSETTTCATCRWWQQRHGDYGECHRLPPSRPPDALSRSEWPVTLGADHCGEWTAREEAAVNAPAPKPKPRERWLVGDRAYETRDDALKRATAMLTDPPKYPEIIHVREVLPGDDD